MYNFNNYELFREPYELDEDCEYVYVTDNKNLKSNKWKVIVDKDLEGLSVFDKCYRVRFNLFKYVTTPVCFYIDGSMQINSSLKPIYEDFIKSGKDLGLVIHDKNNVFDEYNVWLNTRNYSRKQYEKCMAFFKAAKYDPKYKGLYAGGFRIVKNTELNNNLDKFTFDTLVKLGTEKEIERLDQTIYSFVLNCFFENEIAVFPIHTSIYKSKFLTWKCHGTNITHPCNLNFNYDGWLYNKKVDMNRF